MGDDSGQDRPTAIEICAGAGGQALGLHRAGFAHLALVELDPHAVDTLRVNVRAQGWDGWETEEKTNRIQPTDVKGFYKSELLRALNLEKGELSLLAGGVPCPPFSLAGKRLGADDERDLFPDMLQIIDVLRPRAVMIENVRGILEPPEVFIEYRMGIIEKLRDYGYEVPDIPELAAADEQDAAMRKAWRRLDARDFGVPQLRPRAILAAVHQDWSGKRPFRWPLRKSGPAPSVLDTLAASMEARCRPFWDKNEDGRTVTERQRAKGVRTGETVFLDWHNQADKARSSSTEGIAPTLVGGSKKHGGPDLGPTRAKRAWETLGVDASGVANDPDKCDPKRDLFRDAGPMLTVQQAAMLQGFPPEWEFQGGKTARYRQVGNAFPPPVAEAVGRAILAVLRPETAPSFAEDYVVEACEERDLPQPRAEYLPFPSPVPGERRPAGDDRRRDRVGARA
ncbi:DNA cytosine methyltransferase [Streptomyces sp. XM4011]|uniref:DNA cytosine methyltransferase n=1 Tax=Streptomyces TaxID=1883 RepID=UPI001FFA182D|nr:DNA (cytosine-5-)-methyltransferase [Streptomyces sp. XM4011]MCK1817472.1 DNA cytosine methyltransferase [Streptomyces sp. XM4011]